MSSELKVDTISEKTSANGVAIDSVTLKDGAVVGAALTDYVETDVALTSSSGVIAVDLANGNTGSITCLLYTSPSPRDRTRSRMPSSA